MRPWKETRKILRKFVDLEIKFWTQARIMGIPNLYVTS